MATMDGSADALGSNIEADLRLGVARGRTGEAILDVWAAIGGFADRQGSVLADILDSASRVDPGMSSAVAVAADAVAFALVDARGSLRIFADPFADWIGDPGDSIDCRDLARQAGTQGRAIGMVRTPRRGVLAVLAIGAKAADRWPLLVARLGRAPVGAEIALVVFAPSQSRSLVLTTAEALGLSPLETRLVASMLAEPTLEAAARSLGIGRETAKDALECARRKTGALRSQHLVGRLIDLSCHVGAPSRAVAAPPQDALGLTAAEGAVAVRLAAGDTAEEAAAALGLRPGTVKSYRGAMFAKLGIGRTRDLRRLLAEAEGLHRLAAAGEIVAGGPFADEAALRVFIDAGGRNVACLDYGPARGRALILMHGYSTGLTAPPPILAALKARGYRVIIPQRPGFGLTAAAGGDYLEKSANDMALILDGLGAHDVAVLARDGGGPCALAFAQRRSRPLGPLVLLNPRRPRDAGGRGGGPIAAISSLLLAHPGLIDPIAAIMARQSSDEVLGGILRRFLAASAADRACLDQPDVARRLIDDTRRLGRSLEGFTAEQRLFAQGWRASADYAGPRWRLVLSGALTADHTAALWSGVADADPVVLENAGVLAQFTHAEAIAALFD